MSQLRSRFSERPSLLYRLTFAAAAMAMIVLPCLYLALTALVVYATYWFAAHGFLAVWRWPIGQSVPSAIMMMLCSFTPLLAGVGVAAALIKPLFAPTSAHMQPLALNPAMEPRIYALVREVCDLIGAPMPARIELDCELNAAASFPPGLSGFSDNRLTLILGLPLVTALTQRELAGVIAHELGHFRQGVGMRLNYFMRRVNLWFLRAVYERDVWDDTIERWSRDENNGYGAFMFSFVCLAINLMRRLLRRFLFGGLAIGAAYERQAEYDADRQLIRVAGGAAFESWCFKFAVSSVVWQGLKLEMERMWHTRYRLPDNLPLWAAHRAARLSPELRVQLEDALTLTLAEDHPLNRHPSYADRVRRARRMGEPGCNISEAPARELFEHFDSLCRLVTLAHYADDLHLPIQPGYLLPLAQVLQEEEAELRADAEADATPPSSFTSSSTATSDLETGSAKPKVRMLVFDPSKLPAKKPLPDKPTAV